MARRKQVHEGQTDLLEVAHARASDPQTSHDAAARITPELNHLQGPTLEALRVYGPTIDRKLVTVLKGLHGRTDSTWRTRRAELVAKGLVEKYGVVDGHTVWKVKDNG